jgi:hypothetical protein
MNDEFSSGEESVGHLEVVQRIVGRCDRTRRPFFRPPVMVPLPHQPPNDEAFDPTAEGSGCAPIASCQFQVT